MQIILFACFFVADLAASIALYRISPANAICVWYQNAWLYAVGHCIATFLVVGAIALLWWLIGSPAYWESICRTRQRGRTLYQAGLAGVVIDLASSLIIRYIPAFSVEGHLASQAGILPWLLLRAVLWAVFYAGTGLWLMQLLRLSLHSRIR